MEQSTVGIAILQVHVLSVFCSLLVRVGDCFGGDFDMSSPSKKGKPQAEELAVELKRIANICKDDYHKNRDGMVEFMYNAWEGLWSATYRGYVFGDFYICGTNFEGVLKRVIDNLKSMKKSNKLTWERLK